MLNGPASLVMSTSILKALHGKLDIKIHSPSIIYVQVLLLFGCLFSVWIPLSVVSWSVVCSCDISLSYSLTFCKYNVLFISKYYNMNRSM